MGEAVKLFSTAFEQACALRVVGRLVVNSLTRELTAAQATAVLEEQEKLSRKALVLASADSYRLEA
jgi:hypothetical protein